MQDHQHMQHSAGGHEHHQPSSGTLTHPDTLGRSGGRTFPA